MSLDKYNRHFRSRSINGVEVERFDPWLCWSIGTERVEIETRNSYGFGIMRGWRIGNFSRIRHWWIEIGQWTFYLNLGKCKAYNPRASKEEWPDVVE